MPRQTLPIALFEALSFAAQFHQYQRRSGFDRLPYINHLIKVTHLLLDVGKETNRDVLIAGILHDIIEDTDVTHAILLQKFGSKVAGVVSELTDDMELPYEDRKELQIVNAPQLSVAAKKIRIADKASNIDDIFSYPLNWSKERKQNYLENSIKVVDKIRGTNPYLESYFDSVVNQYRKQ